HSFPTRRSSDLRSRLNSFEKPTTKTGKKFSTCSVRHEPMIAAGSYLVGAALPERSADSSEGPATLESAVLVAVTVTDSDVDNVVLAVRPPMSMPGRLRIDGSRQSFLCPANGVESGAGVLL